VNSDTDYYFNIDYVDDTPITSITLELLHEQGDFQCPVELFLLIISMVDSIQDLVQLRLLNSTFKIMIDDDRVWKQRYEREYTVYIPPSTSNSTSAPPSPLSGVEETPSLPSPNTTPTIDQTIEPIIHQYKSWRKRYISESTSRFIITQDAAPFVTSANNGRTVSSLSTPKGEASGGYSTNGMSWVNVKLNNPIIEERIYKIKVHSGSATVGVCPYNFMAIANELGGRSPSWSYAFTGNFGENGTWVYNKGTTFGGGEIIGVQLRKGCKKISFYRNGVLQNYECYSGLDKFSRKDLRLALQYYYRDTSCTLIN